MERRFAPAPSVAALSLLLLGVAPAGPPPDIALFVEAVAVEDDRAQRP